MRPLPCVLTLGLALGGVLPARAAPERPVLISVRAFTNKLSKPSESQGDAKILESGVKGAVARALPTARVLDRDQAYEILRQVGGEALAEKCEDLCVKEQAEKVGADYSITGTVVQAGDLVMLSLGMIETASGTIASSVQVRELTLSGLLGKDLTSAVQTLLEPITLRAALEEKQRKDKEQKESEAREATLRQLRQQREATDARLKELEQQAALADKQKAVVEKNVELAQATRGRVWTWVAGGTAVVALGLAGVFGAQSKSTASDISDTLHTRQEQDALRTQYESQSGRANLMLGVGVALVAVTGTFFVLRF